MVLSTVAALAGLGSAIYGAVASSKQNKDAQRMIQQKRDDNDAWYARKSSEDFTRRSDAQAVIQKQRELLEEQRRNTAATNAVTGGTDASVALEKAAANDAMAQTMSDIASNASDYKDKVEQEYRAQDNALAQQQAAQKSQQAANTAQAASQAVGAAVNLAGAFAGAKNPTVSQPSEPMGKQQLANDIANSMNTTIKTAGIASPTKILSPDQMDDVRNKNLQQIGS